MYHNQLFNEAIKKLNSKDEKKIIEGIKSLRESGKPEAVKNIAALLDKDTSIDIIKECEKFFNDIKDQAAVKYIIEIIKNKPRKGMLKILVSSSWQNNLDFSPFLDTFADIVLKEKYIIAYEAFTVIENNIDKLPADKANKIEKKISEGIGKSEKEKQPMLEELLHIVHDLKKQ